MRYDDYDDYSRSSRNRSSGSSRGSSSYSGRDYDRNYRDYDRSYSSRDYDRYDREYSSRSSRDYDRSYSSSRRGGYDDFSDWERTAPNWDDRSSSRSRSSGSSRGTPSRSSRDYDRYDDRYDRDYDRPRSGGSRNGSRPSGTGSRNGTRPSGQKKGQKKRKKGGVQIVPIVLGLVLIVLAVLIIKSFIGGGGSDYALSISSKTIVVDETATATVTGLSATETYDIQWSSSDNGVVSVDGNGETCTLLAKSNGSVTITATVNGETVEDTVMVVDVAPGVKDIKFSQETVEIISGETYTVEATVIMESEDMTPAKLSWSSKDNSVARVSEDGVIEAREVGTTIIKATAGEQTAEIAVTVVPNPNSETHDESQSTGAEPEEGATPPEGTATGGQDAATGTEEDADAPAEGEGETTTE